MKSLYLCFSFLVFAASQLEISALTKENRAFLDGHNSRRLRVAKGEVRRQPAAAKMNKIMWDDELYLKASEYAETLPRDHNPDRSVPSDRFKTGENLYYYATTDHNHNIAPDDALRAWFIEHQNYTYGPLQDSDFDGSSNNVIGHYTQMVWSDTIYVGCAISQNYEGKWKEFFVVCNYGPAGNFIDEVPYKRGSGVRLLSCACDDDDDESCDCS